MSRDVPLRLVLVGELLWLLNRAYTALMRCRAWRWEPTAHPTTNDPRETR